MDSSASITVMVELLELDTFRGSKAGDDLECFDSNSVSRISIAQIVGSMPFIVFCGQDGLFRELCIIYTCITSIDLKNTMIFAHKEHSPQGKCKSREL